jgi:prepilin-type processing-associated H-X9-DG protein
MPNNTGIDSCGWANAIYPYVKAKDIYYCSSTGVDQQGLWYWGPEGNGYYISYTYNGDLGSIPSAKIVNPTKVEMLWSGLFKNRFANRFTSSPNLNCSDTTQPCVFNMGGTGNGSSDSPNIPGGCDSVNEYIHGHGDNFLYADGHVKWGSTVDNGASPYLADASGNFRWTYYVDGACDNKYTAHMCPATN